MVAKLVLPKDAAVVGLEDRLARIDTAELSDDWYRRAVTVLRGGDGGEHGKLLYKLALAVLPAQPDAITLDVGTARGFSALVMARAMQDAKLIGTVYTVDTVGHSESVNWHIEKHSQDDPLVGLSISRREIWDRWYRDGSSAVVVAKGRSVELLSSWKHGPIGVAFLDGSHSYEDVRQELALLDGLMVETGVILLDDYHLGEVVGRIRSRALNLLAWLIGQATGWVSKRFRALAPRLGQATEYRLVKQRFSGVKRAVDEFMESGDGCWSMEAVAMPRRGTYQGEDYCTVILSRGRIKGGAN